MEFSHCLATFPEDFALYTDHNNLIFIFHPIAMMPDIFQSSLSKLLRWAARMSSYNYVSIHISGSDNFWAIRRLISIPPLPTSFAEYFAWPSVACHVKSSGNVQFEDMLNGGLQIVHYTRLQYYSDASLDTQAILSCVLASETGMPVYRPFELVEVGGMLFFNVLWKGLGESDGIMEPLQCAYEDDPQLLEKLCHKNSNAKLREQAFFELRLSKGVFNAPTNRPSYK